METRTEKTTIAMDLEIQVRIKWDVDTDPDLSYLGEYASHPKGEHYIDREEHGDMLRGEYRYFNLGCGEEDYMEQDYKRMEAYQHQEWCMMFCVITVRCGALESFASLGGIESDSSDDYFKEEEKNLTDEAIGDLKKKIMARIAVE
jgi:hypothetical protein